MFGQRQGSYRIKGQGSPGQVQCASTGPFRRRRVYNDIRLNYPTAELCLRRRMYCVRVMCKLFNCVALPRGARINIKTTFN